MPTCRIVEPFDVIEYVCPCVISDRMLPRAHELTLAIQDPSKLRVRRARLQWQLHRLTFELRCNYPSSHLTTPISTSHLSKVSGKSGRYQFYAFQAEMGRRDDNCEYGTFAK